MKEQCGIVRDLLPIYTEGLTCEESNKMISAHLDQCADCRKTLDRMRMGQVKTTFNTETDQMFQNYVKTRNKKARNRRVPYQSNGAYSWGFRSILDLEITPQVRSISEIVKQK